MMQAKAFQAQSLDNSSPDHLRLAGAAEELRGSARAQVYSTMAGISSQGKLLFAQDGVRLLFKGNSAVLQVVPEERDKAGRLAPVMCWIEQDGVDASKPQPADAVWSSIADFSAAIGRSFSASTRSAVGEALELFEKKKSTSGRLMVSKAKPLQWRWPAWLRRILMALRIIR